MISENNKSNSVSSADVRNNFKNNKKNRHIGLKISVFLVAIFISLLIYFTYSKFSKENKGTQPISDSASVKIINPPIQQGQDSLKVMNDTLNQINPIFELFATGSTPNELRENLKSVSNSYMKNKEYTPVSCRIFSSIKKISFKLIKKPSDFTKLSLCFGEYDSLTNSCESCVNILFKNKGSYEIASTKSKSKFIYKVVCIKE